MPEIAGEAVTMSTPLEQLKNEILNGARIDKATAMELASSADKEALYQSADAGTSPYRYRYLYPY